MQVRLEGGSSLRVRAWNLRKRIQSTDGVDSLHIFFLHIQTLVLGPLCIYMCVYAYTHMYIQRGPHM